LYIRDVTGQLPDVTPIGRRRIGIFPQIAARAIKSRRIIERRELSHVPAEELFAHTGGFYRQKRVKDHEKISGSPQADGFELRSSRWDSYPERLWLYQHELGFERIRNELFQRSGKRFGTVVFRPDQD